MVKPKKIPMRMCIGCNVMKPKNQLIRVVKNKQDEIFLDKTGKAAGRGAYICADAKCFALMKKGNRLTRAFSSEIDSEIYDSLTKELEDAK